jgi:putative peptide zinc metalloprotease protein
VRRFRLGEETPRPPSGAESSHVANDGRPPELAEGIELLGEYRDSGFKEAPFLARRADGQVLQLPRLMYLVAEKVDGRRNYAQIAEAVTEQFGRGVSEDNVRVLVDNKLRPLGVLAAPDGTSLKLQRPNPLLALNFKTAVVPPGLVNGVTVVFRPLFWPLVIIVTVAGFIALDWWLFFVHGIAQGLRNLINEPVFFLIVFGLVVLSAAFHESGHATGCRYGGARPGVMGVGIYLVWPAFYTDVTDAYRLSKGGRLRTDLGGVYFNAIFMLVALGAYLVTHFEVLIAAILLLQFEMIHQFLPFLRLDGYYMIADLAGVPDIFARMKSILLSLLPWRKPDPQVMALKNWVRVVVTGWVILTVAFVLYAYGIILLHLPSIVGTAWASFLSLTGHTAATVQHGELALGLFSALQIILLTLPVLGLGWMLGRLMERLVVQAWVRTRGRPFHRVTAYLVMAAAMLMLVAAWTPPSANYRPISPNARGTIPESFNDAPAVFENIARKVPPLQQVVPAPSPSASPSSSSVASPTGSPTVSPLASPSESPSSSPNPSPTPSSSP